MLQKGTVINMALIYIVEDDNDILEVETFALKNSNYEVKGFTNAKDFYAAVEEKVPSLAVLDVMLPDEDGLQIVQNIRHNPRAAHVPVIMVTARTTEIDKVKGLDMGADDYLTKPFGVMELIARVRALLRRIGDGKDEKKVLSLVLCVAVMLSVMVMGAGAAFSDQDKIENTEAVNMCTALNIIGGYPDGSYKPEGNIKRSEITKMICVALNGGKEPNVSTNTTPTFSDVRGTNAAWAEGYIESCVAQGIISGGMIPKMECCVDAIAGGVERVHILDGRIPHSILIELLSDEGIGTMLKKED